jgi:hypothetical protein
MNLSRRAKLFRETPARVAARNPEPVASEPDATEQVPPPPSAGAATPTAVPVAEVVVAVETPKLPRFVRPVAEKRAAVKPAVLTRSTTASGRMMSLNLATEAPAGGAVPAATRKGPKVGRVPLVNTRRPV